MGWNSEKMLEVGMAESQSDAEQSLWDNLHAICKDRFGTTSILYGFTHSIHLTDRVGFTKSLFIKHSYPAEYAGNFREGNLLEDEIGAAILYKSNGPHLWDELRKLPRLSRGPKAPLPDRREV